MDLARNWQVIDKLLKQLKQSCVRLMGKQQRELCALVDDIADIFAADERDCTPMNIVQHSTDTGKVHW